MFLCPAKFKSGRECKSICTDLFPFFPFFFGAGAAAASEPPRALLGGIGMPSKDPTNLRPILKTLTLFHHFLTHNCRRHGALSLPSMQNQPEVGQRATESEVPLHAPRERIERPRNATSGMYSAMHTHRPCPVPCVQLEIARGSREPRQAVPPPGELEWPEEDNVEHEHKQQHTGVISDSDDPPDREVSDVDEPSSAGSEDSDAEDSDASSEDSDAQPNGMRPDADVEWVRKLCRSLAIMKVNHSHARAAHIDAHTGPKGYAVRLHSWNRKSNQGQPRGCAHTAAVQASTYHVGAARQDGQGPDHRSS